MQRLCELPVRQGIRIATVKKRGTQDQQSFQFPPSPPANTSVNCQKGSSDRPGSRWGAFAIANVLSLDKGIGFNLLGMAVLFSST